MISMRGTKNINMENYSMWTWACGVKSRSSCWRESRWVVEKFWNSMQKKIRENQRERRNENNKKAGRCS